LFFQLETSNFGYLLIFLIFFNCSPKSFKKSTYVTEGVQSLTKEIKKYNHYSSNDSNALCIVAINAPFDPTSQGSFLFNQTAIVIIDIITTG
jgi:hypothetical protein